MSTLPEITFVSADFDAEVEWLEDCWTSLGGGIIQPASPERLFIQFVASILCQQCDRIDFAAKQNVPRYATGEYLDSLSDIFYRVSRLEASAAVTEMEFTMSEALKSAQVIPAGTRIRSADSKAVFATDEDVTAAVGETTATVTATCDTTGESGNGYAVGTITDLVDVFPYYESCQNITESEGGSDEETDEALYQRMRESMEAYTTAGSSGAYEYWAMSVSTAIASAKAVSPMPNWVTIYVLLQDGELPGETILDQVLEACSADNVKLMTDVLEVKAPDVHTYDIELTWYVAEGSEIPVTTVQSQVAEAIETYKQWQCAQMGRHINPTKLVGLLYLAGASRVDVVSPVHEELLCDETGCEVAQCGSESITFGGYCD